MKNTEYLDVSSAKTTYVARQHVERYRFAARVLQPGMRVLDIASGAGYGSAMLEQVGCHVTAGDYDESALRLARQVVSEVLQCNALQLPFADAVFDAVVSFETIEHVATGDIFLKEVRRVLKPGGILICSTPNIAFTVHPWYHLKEYTPDEFFALVETIFPGVERHVQVFSNRDYWRDRFNRRIKRPLVNFARQLGLIGSPKPAPQAETALPGNSIVPVPTLNSLDTQDAFYAVEPLGRRGERIRIMIAVSRKSE